MTGYRVDRSRWAQLTIIEQMANISSEVGQSVPARRAGDQARLQHAVARAIDLFDATVESLPTDTSFRAREVLRAKDQFLHVIGADPLDDAAAVSLERYFVAFAMAARRDR